MIAGYLKFNTLPEIGFAHNYFGNKYEYHYGKSKYNFEIVYISSGGLSVEYNGEIFYAEEGSIFVLFRHLPIKVYSSENIPQSHCTIQIGLEYDFELADIKTTYPDDGILLPFVLPPTHETEEIIKEIRGVIYQVSTSPERYSFNASLKVLGIMEKIDRIARSDSYSTSSAHKEIASLVSNYVENNIDKKITLQDLSDVLKKSPNYINHAFKNAKGKSITEYINSKKVTRICSLMQKDNIPFPKACELTGIFDVSYGYRIFKKHIGITPSAYLKSEKIVK